MRCRPIKAGAESGQQVQIDSGSDTTLKGAVVKADQVTANVGGNLNIESLQDSATYKDKQNSAGVGVSICVPPFCYGQAAIVNVSAAKAKINSDYQSVSEQSGLKAGDGGFTVNVQGNTDLKGSAITSTQAAIDQNKNTFNTGGKLTTSDIQNTASYDAKSVSVSISTGGGGAAGFGSDSGQASSTTKAAISGIAGDTAARTGDKEAGIKPIFDANKVKADVQLQTAVTGEFGRNASKAVGDLGTSKTKPYTDAKNYTDLKKAQEEGRLDASSALVLAGLEKAGMTADKANQTLNDPQVQADYNNWKEGGAYRVAAHTVVGGLTGGVAGAAGAGTVSAAAPTLDEVQGQMTQALVKAGMEAKTAQGLAGAVTGVGAAGIGAAVSGGTTAGAATAFNADVNNRQLHPTEAKLIKANAKAYAQQRFGTANPSDAQLSQAETELTQQALKQVDSANATYADNQNAAIFLSQVARAAGPNQDVGGGTLFDARGTSAYNNQAINAGLLDQSKDLLSNVNAPGNRPGTTAYQYNLNAAAMDKANLANQPAQVKQQVFTELKDQYQAQANELTPQLLRTDPIAYAQKEAQLQNTFGTLLRMVTDQGVSYLGKAELTWYQSNIQNKAMGVAAGAMAIGLGGAVTGAAKLDTSTSRGDMYNQAKAESAVAKADAQAVEKTKLETNARTDDAQQYVNNNAPIQVPETVTRNDNDFSSTVNQRGNPKANIDDSGNLVAANPNGTGSPTAHVSGSNPGNTPYISATDAASVDPTLGGPKVYGTQQTTINARELQRDINSGAASQDIEIINNQQLVDQLQTKVDAAQRKFDANPSRNNAEDLRAAQRDLNATKRDGEVLITPYVPPTYYTPPTGPVTPIVPVLKVPSTPTSPEQPIK